MKRELCCLTVCLLLASSSVTAQSRTSEKAEKSPIQSFIGKASKIHHLQNTTHKLTEENLLTGLDITYLDEGEWFYGTRVDFTYESGRMVEQTVESRVGQVWTIESRKTIIYENGLIKEEVYEELNDQTEELDLVDRYSYSYSNEVISELLYEVWADGAWEVGYKDVFTISGDQISEGITYYWMDDEWISTDRFTLEETNISLIYTSFTRSDSEEWVNSEREIYPNMTIDQLYDIVFNLNSTLHLSAILIYNQFPDFTSQEWDGENWVNDEQQYTTLYNTPNELLETKYINTVYWEDDNWVPGRSLVHYYNEKTNPDSTLLNILMESGETSEWNVYMKEVYSYNSEGLYDEISVHVNPELGIIAYKYKFEWNGLSTDIEEPEKPALYALHSAYPNPFNPATTVTYSLEQAGYIRINIYDMLGRQVSTLINGVQSAGEHRVQFNADGLSSGLYLVRMEAPGYLKTQKIMLLK